MISIVVLTYNRLGRLGATLQRIEERTSTPHEIIVVNNGSADGTREFLDAKKGPMFHPIHLSSNMGVVARNHGFRFATGNFIAQIDDDVDVLAGWDTKCLEAFRNDQTIGMVGQQGGIIKRWMDIHSNVHETVNGYVDYLTGFFLMMRNHGFMYDEAFGMFWHEELDLSFQLKYAGFSLYKLDGLCIHHSARTSPVDWDLHNRNLHYTEGKWRDKREKLSLVGGG